MSLHAAALQVLLLMQVLLLCSAVATACAAALRAADAGAFVCCCCSCLCMLQPPWMQLLLKCALCYSLCIMRLPLHAAVNMHVGAIVRRTRRDHVGHAALTTCLAFHVAFHSQDTLNLVGLCTSI